jgi:hypothetical protein
MSRAYPVFAIGTPGTPWGTAERSAWRALQTKKRDFFLDAVKPLRDLVDGPLAPIAELIEYGSLDYSAHYDFACYKLYALRSRPWTPSHPSVIVTGGVHGYETSGVQGAVMFAQQHFAAYAAKSVNLLVLPCVAPWGYETINRWTPETVDPNRSFNPDEPGCMEAALAMKFIRESIGSSPILAHFDLHETTDTDNSEFVPAKFARDGTAPTAWHAIPDGFYVFGDVERGDNLPFLEAIIAGVRGVTHIAAAENDGTICGEAVTMEGVIMAPDRPLRLCALHTAAKYAVTTEVYPDSPKTNAEECNRAQVAAVCCGLDYAITHQ